MRFCVLGAVHTIFVQFLLRRSYHSWHKEPSMYILLCLLSPIVQRKNEWSLQSLPRFHCNRNIVFLHNSRYRFWNLLYIMDHDQTPYFQNLLLVISLLRPFGLNLTSDFSEGPWRVATRPLLCEHLLGFHLGCLWPDHDFFPVRSSPHSTYVQLDGADTDLYELTSVNTINWVTPTTIFLMWQLIVTSRSGRTEYQLLLMKVWWWDRNVKIIKEFGCDLWILERKLLYHKMNIFLEKKINERR